MININIELHIFAKEKQQKSYFSWRSCAYEYIFW